MNELLRLNVRLHAQEPCCKHLAQLHQKILLDARIEDSVINVRDRGSWSENPVRPGNRKCERMLTGFDRKEEIFSYLKNEIKDLNASLL